MQTSPTIREMLEEVLDLSVGLGVMLMPALLLVMPAILLVVVPAIVLLIPVALIGAVLAAPYLLFRAVLRSVRRYPRAEAPSGRPVATEA